MLLNAFDLVRIHKFGDEDEKKSFQSMAEFAMEQDRVRLAIADERELQLTVHQFRFQVQFLYLWMRMENRKIFMRTVLRTK